MSTTKTSQKRQANFFISSNILENLKEQVPPRKQSEFVEQAIEKELKHRQFLEALEKCAGAWKDEDHPEDTGKFIRALRESQRI